MEKKNITAVIYARVSTNGQDYDRQLNDLREYASRMGYNVVKEFAEKISGAKKVAEREALTELLSFVEAKHIDKVLIYECSRLSRRVADFINIVDRLNELHISLYIHQNGLETLQADGKVNPIAQLVIGMLAQFNSMERSLIRSRMESGYNNYRNNGGVVGGGKSLTEKRLESTQCRQNHRHIRQYFKKNQGNLLKSCLFLLVSWQICIRFANIRG